MTNPLVNEVSSTMAILARKTRERKRVDCGLRRVKDLVGSAELRTQRS